MVKEITRKELKAKIDRRDDFYLVEALARWHYEMSHLPREINLPYEFVDEAEKVLPDKRAQIVVYCMNKECEASREEARELEEMGYRHILHYAGGKRVGSGPGSPWKAGGRAHDAEDKPCLIRWRSRWPQWCSHSRR